MNTRLLAALCAALLVDATAQAGPASRLLPRAQMQSTTGPAGPVRNAAFAPGNDARAAPPG